MKKKESQELANEIYGILTNGWSQRERKMWSEYLEVEVKPFYPRLYAFLKKGSDK